MRTSLKTQVLKTATVSSVKLLTPADRIGQGLACVVYPADVLSPGQFPLPHNPGSEPNSGSRQELSATLMFAHQPAMATAVPPAGPAGCPVPGCSAHRRPWSASRLDSRWRMEGKRPASRASFPAVPSHPSRSGRDCQSPDRRDDRRPAIREAAPAAAAGK
jgi:hypothetical protein